MDTSILDIIKSTKRQLVSGGADLTKAFEVSRDALRREADIIAKETAAGHAVIPQINHSEIAQGTVGGSVRDQVRRRGCVIIRNVFPRSQAEDWNEELGRYISENSYFEKQKEQAALDKYFSQLDAGLPQIYGLYWSKPQIMARQAPEMAITKRFLNRLWDTSGPSGEEFVSDVDYAYADRTRRRQPGDRSLGLSPHMDAGSFERWTDPAFQKIYGHVFAGRWDDFDPWKAAYRTQTVEYPSPAVCSAFRTFQGWTALTPQGPVTVH